MTTLACGLAFTMLGRAETAVPGEWIEGARDYCAKKKAKDPEECEQQLLATWSARRQKDADREAAAAKLKEYRADYAAITDLETARAFVRRYQGQFDPERLTTKAVGQAYSVMMKAQLDCQAEMRAVIRKQEEIGRASGFVNKAVMYEAGSRLVACRDRGTEIALECIRAKVCGQQANRK